MYRNSKSKDIFYFAMVFIPGYRYISKIFTFEAKKKQSLIETERVAQLDESFKGKDKFTGDSMMIAENMKKKKNKERSFGFIKPNTSN